MKLWYISNFLFFFMGRYQCFLKNHKSDYQLIFNPNRYHYKLRSLSLKRDNYHMSQRYYEQYLRRLNSKNITIQNNEILGEEYENENEIRNFIDNENKNKLRINKKHSKQFLTQLGIRFETQNNQQNPRPSLNNI